VSYTQEKTKTIEVVEGWSFKLDLDEKLEKTFNPNQT